MTKSAATKNRRRARRARVARQPPRSVADDSEYSVVCQHCGRRLRAVNNFHLRAAHGYQGDHPVYDYERTFLLPVAMCGNSRTKISAGVSLFWKVVADDELDQIRENMSAAGARRWNSLPEAERQHFGQNMSAAKTRYWKKLGKHWTEERVLAEIRKRHQAGYSLRSKSIPKDLEAAGFRYFGTWSAAIEKAGFDYHEITARRHWDREKIVAEIRKLAADGIRLYSTVAQREHGAVFQAAGHEFVNGWPEALAAAGLNPAEHVAPRTDWTREKAEAWVHERIAAPASLKASAVPLNLLHFVRSHLQSTWSSFVESFGIPYPGQKKCMNWTKRKVLAEIKRRDAAGSPMNSKAVQRGYYSLFEWASKLFGSWDAACRAAGLDPNVYRKTPPPWDKDKAVQWIHAQIKAGRSVRAEAAPGALRRFVRSTLKQSWREFVEGFEIGSGGVGPRIGYWTSAMVLEEIRRWKKEGHQMNAGSVQAEYNPLLRQATKFFQSWDTARAAAGIEVVRLPSGPRRADGPQRGPL